MTLARLTIIALSGATIMFSGCSTDNRITGTGFDSNQVIDNKLTELNPVTPQPITGARVAVRSGDSDNEPERFSIVAKVKSLDFENGCWYLVADDGETYTPVTPKGLILVNGLSLKAQGYVDKDIQFFCGNGPAFVIEEYEILERPKDSDNERYSGIKTGNGSLNEIAVVNDLFEDRAPSQPTEERSPQDLRDRASEAKKKYEEEQKGSEQPRDESAQTVNDNDRASGPSDAAPSDGDQMQRQQEEKKKYEEGRDRPKQPKDESAPTMYDNDRPSGPSDSFSSDEDQMQRQQEEKKKYEEEQKPKDMDNDRP